MHIAAHEKETRIWSILFLFVFHFFKYTTNVFLRITEKELSDFKLSIFAFRLKKTIIIIYIYFCFPSDFLGILLK
jgi:hypothetical protein